MQRTYGDKSGGTFFDIGAKTGSVRVPGMNKDLWLSQQDMQELAEVYYIHVYMYTCIHTCMWVGGCA